MNPDSNPSMRDVAHHRGGSVHAGAVIMAVVVAFVNSVAPALAQGFNGVGEIANVGPRAPLRPASAAEAARQHIERMQARAARGLSSLADIDDDRARLRALRTELQAERAQATAELDENEAHLLEKRLPDSIRQRQREARLRLASAADAVEKDIGAVETAGTLTGVREGLARLRSRSEQLRTQRRHQDFDPAAMPFGRAKEIRRAPRTRNADFSALTLGGQGTPALAASSALPFTALAAASPADLQPTEEVVLTPEIIELAASLEHDPIRIYEWVYHNITYVPTYGSIQGSEGALRTRRANAIDTSSLLIALLRASNVPARYVFGTVEIPIDKVRNWVGGVDSPNAALDLLAQGNVPVLGLAQSGRIVAARVEHVWVEAYVDFAPSRGAKNLVPDSWIPMDASYKQYVYSEGSDIVNAPPAQSLPSFDQLQAQLSFDPALGRISGLSAAAVRTLYDEATPVADGWLRGTPVGSDEPPRLRTVSVDMRLLPVLPASLPYKVVASSPGLSVVPASARRSFQVAIYRSALARVNGDSPAMSFTSSLPQLAGKQLSVRFSPATDDDVAALQSLMPQPGPDGTIDPDTLPRSIPGYLIRLNAAVTLDGVEVARANDFVLGEEIATRLSIQRHSGEWYQADNTNTAGEFLAISLDLQGTGADPLEKVDAQTPENLLHEAGRAYWANLDEHLSALARIRLAVGVRQPSFSVFSTVFEPTYRYGIPTNVRLNGVSVDVDASFTSMMSFDGDPARTRQAVEQHGMVASALEHGIPQAYLASPEQPVNGASALSAIAAAVSANQPLYQVTAGNFSSVRQQLSQSFEVLADVERAVGAGFHVLISQSPAQIDDWNGTGYIIIDPETGSGAYRISGGMNGGAAKSDIAVGMNVLGILPGLLITISKSFASKANDCQDEDNGGRQPQVQLDWKFWLFMALLMAMIVALTTGTGGAMAPVAARAVSSMLLVVAPMSAFAGGGGDGGCTTLYYGAFTIGGPTLMSNAHVRGALATGKPPMLSYTGEDLGFSRSWLPNTFECNKAAKDAYEQHTGIRPDCDEYPLASTWQGGYVNYVGGKVSLLLIDFDDNRRAGGAYGWFLYDCRVMKNGRFKVEPTIGPFRGEKKDGNICYLGGSPP